MVAIVDSLCESAALGMGDRVQTLRGSTSGTVVRVLDDGRVVWKPDGSTMEFTGLPESLKRVYHAPNPFDERWILGEFLDP